MKQLSKKGSYIFMEYDNGWFAIDYSDPDIGTTLKFSRKKDLLRFDSINPNLTLEDNGFTIRRKSNKGVYHNGKLSIK